MDLTDRAKRCGDYVKSLEEERRKVMVFQRELPLCLQLVTQAIESCRQLIGGEEDPSSDGRPLLEEFIPLKPSSSESEESRQDKPVEQEMSSKKPNWLQLWNQEPEPGPERDIVRKPVAVKAKTIGRAFHPFEKEKHVLVSDRPTPATSSTDVTGGGEKDNKEKEGLSHPQPHSNRKARRCWSPELHRQFLHALEQVGGSDVATPKQIRELMKVDGLTNDEVKSHLQKYRLHSKRSSSTIPSSSPQTPHFVVVGGIWVPPPEYAAAAATTFAAASQPTEAASASLKGIYAPVASHPREFRSENLQNKKSNRPPNEPLHSEGRWSQDDSSLADDGASNSALPTSSSST